MELMDWKSIETNSERAINDGKMSIEVANILLFRARIEIKKLGGETNEEINAQAKAEREKEDQKE